MPLKPVIPGRTPDKSPAKNERPPTIDKRAARMKLESKGVPRSVAKHVTGEDEPLDADQIAARRIAWQKGLPKA